MRMKTKQTLLSLFAGPVLGLASCSDESNVTPPRLR